MTVSSTGFNRKRLWERFADRVRTSRWTKGLKIWHRGHRGMFSTSADGIWRILIFRNLGVIRTLKVGSELRNSLKIIEKHIVSLYTVLRAVSRAQMTRALSHGTIDMQECKNIEFLLIPDGYLMEISMVELSESSRNHIFSSETPCRPLSNCWSRCVIPDSLNHQRWVCSDARTQNLCICGRYRWQLGDRTDLYLTSVWRNPLMNWKIILSVFL